MARDAISAKLLTLPRTPRASVHLPSYSHTQPTRLAARGAARPPGFFDGSRCRSLPVNNDGSTCRSLLASNDGSRCRSYPILFSGGQTGTQARDASSLEGGQGKKKRGETPSKPAGILELSWSSSFLTFSSSAWPLPCSVSPALARSQDDVATAA